MSSFAKIIAAISPFKIPHAPGIYTGPKSSGWIVYNYADDRGEDFADDEPGIRKVSLQVHLYLPARENFLTIKEQIREALFAQEDFTYPAVTDLGEDSIGKRHLVFEFDSWEPRTSAEITETEAVNNGI